MNHNELEILVRRTQPESWIVWLFDWLGTRWEAQAFYGRTPIYKLCAFSNTRRGAIRKVRKLVEIEKTPNEWTPV